MILNNWKFILVSFGLFFLNTNNIIGQCEWIETFAESNDPVIEYDDVNNVLFFCDDTVSTIIVPNSIQGQPLVDAIWSYTTDQGQECQDWTGAEDGNYYFSVDFNDPCMQNAESIIINFNGVLEDQSNVSCSFNIEFQSPGEPVISLDNYNTEEQIIICEENTDVTLFADAIGTSPNSNYVSYQWYVNGEPITDSDTPEISISNTNYDLNSSNTFYFTIDNYCSQGIIESDWITISIYEGYDDCEPCSWEFPKEKNNEFYGFSPNGDEKNDHFPEIPNNQENRTIESPITCEATTYRVTIYNRIGRTIFESSYDNHPWDGKTENGKDCKEGTYFYKLEYILNPTLENDDQSDKKFSFGSVQLAN